jgi:hypothetical protein
MFLRKSPRVCDIQTMHFLHLTYHFARPMSRRVSRDTGDERAANSGCHTGYFHRGMNEHYAPFISASPNNALEPIIYSHNVVP